MTLLASPHRQASLPGARPPGRLHLRRAAIVWSATLLLCLCAVNGAALPLAAYRERVRHVMLMLDQFVAGETEADAEAFLAARARAIAEARRLLPATETVEHEGRTTQVDNSWLHEALTVYESSPARVAGERDLALESIVKRLYALDEQLAAAQNTPTRAAGTEEEKARLAAILRRPEFNEAARASALQQLLARFRRWLSSLLPRPQPLGGGDISPLWRQILIYAVCAVGLIALFFALWKLLPGIRRRKPSAKLLADRVVLGERLAPDQSSADLLTEAEALARAGDLRAAIRKAYIALLCELGERKVIRLAQHKTNRDYLRAVRDQAALYATMRPLTERFEHVWYGYEPATAADWQEFRAGWQQAIKS